MEGSGALARSGEPGNGCRARSIPELKIFTRRIFDSEECMSSVRSYRPRPDDIIISPIGESGTTLLQQMFHTLRTRGDMDFDDISRVVPWIEMARALDIDLNAPQKAEPRGFKSHMLYEEIPKGARYIVSLRDPKDTIVSRFRHHEGWLFDAGVVQLSSYVRSAIRARKHQEMWTHLIGWWQRRENPNVLLLSYEHMVADPRSNVRAVARFCGIPLDDGLLELTLARCSLSFMLQHRSRFDDVMLRKLAKVRCGIPEDGDASKVRRGGVGSHRTQLSPDLVSVMEAAWLDVVTPVLGFRDYGSFESALRGRVIARS